MVVITSKQENKVFGFGNQLEYLPNGYPVIVDKGVGFALSDINIYEDVQSVPEEVVIGNTYTPQKKDFILTLIILNQTKILGDYHQNL